MNNRKTNLKRFTKATATLMICTAALNVTISKARASDNTHPDSAPTSATYSSSSSTAVAPQSNNSSNNGNVVWNENPRTTNGPSTTSSQDTTNTSSNDDNQSSQKTSASSNPATDFTNTEQSTTTNDTTSSSNSSAQPSDIAVSFVSNGHIVGTDYFSTDDGDINIITAIPQGYELQDLSQASLNAKDTNGVANIDVTPVSISSDSSATNANMSGNNSDHDTNENSNENSNGNNSSSNLANDTHVNNNDNGMNINGNLINHPETNTANDDSENGGTNNNDGKLPFPPAPKVNTDHQHSSSKSKVKRHPQPAARPKKQYRHPVQQPARVLTPPTPPRINHHRTERTQVHDPMLRPGYNPDRIRHAKDFKSQVHFTHRDRPRNVHRIKPYHDFDATVLRYRPMLHKVTRHYHMTKYDTLFLAIMEVESKGNGKDIMQSSESAGLKPGSLDSRQSIEQAVRYMKSITDKAHAMDRVEHHDRNINPNDYHDYASDDRLLSQAYNFGGGFLDYVAHSKYGYSEAMSQKYSRDVVAKQLGNPDDKTYAYNKPVAQMYHKSFLYRNGGNFLYADEVSQYLVSGYMKSILNNLMQYRGRPYVFGGKTPQTDFDCSGLVSYGFKTIGLNGFPDFTETQWHATKPVKNWNRARAGDLVFFKGTYGDKDFISHVGFLIDKHTMFDSNSRGVEFTDLDQPYWREHFAGIQRVPYRHRLNKMALQHQGTDYNHTSGTDDTDQMAY